MKLRFVFSTISLVLALLYGVEPTSALTCYRCTQPKGQNLACETNVEIVQQAICPERDDMCIKYVWTTTGSSVVSRHCASPDYCQQLSLNSSSFNTLELCESCGVDLCNSVIILRTSVLWAFIVPLATKTLM